MNTKLDKAIEFLFDETYTMWRSDLEKIFRIGTRSKSGGCNFSSCVLVLIGIESFSKFFSEEKNAKSAFVDFFDSYYPSFYHSKTKQIYELFRNGLAHYFYPKIRHDRSHAAGIRFWLDREMKVISLSAIRKDLDYYRSKGVVLDPEKNKPIVLVPQVLFIDTIDVMESLRIKVTNDEFLQRRVEENYLKVKKGLNHAI